jgi:hypothetical protein
MDIDKKIKLVLETATGLKVHPIKKPLKAAVPCIVYRRVTGKNEVAHSGNLNNARDRIQVIAVHTSFLGLRGLVTLIENSLIGNKTDWQVSLPTEIKLEDWDEEAGIWSCSRDFLFRYNNI